MMKKRLIFTLLLAAFIVACFAQKPYKVMFYNLENFFDTINDPEVLEYDIETFVYSRRKPFDLQKFTDFVEQEWPDEVIRVKGPLWQTGDPDMCYMFEQAGHQMRLMENGLFVDSAPEGEKQKIIDENPEIMQIWDDETGDRMTSLCIIGRHMDKDALIASLDACLTDWHRA